MRQPAHSPGMDQPVLKAPWRNGTLKNSVLYCSQKQLYSFPGAPARQTELYCGCAFSQSNGTLFSPCPPGQPAAHACTSRAGRALEGRLRHLLHRAMAPSTSTTYRAGIRKYYAFCTQFNLNPLSPRVQARTPSISLRPISAKHSRPTPSRCTWQLSPTSILLGGSVVRPTTTQH